MDWDIYTRSILCLGNGKSLRLGDEENKEAYQTLEINLVEKSRQLLYRTSSYNFPYQLAMGIDKANNLVVVWGVLVAYATALYYL